MAYSYLTMPESMTAFLRQQTANTINVKVLSTGVTKAHYIREVILSSINKPLIYAQTSIPNKHHIVYSHLRRLGNKALGDYLFQHKCLQRSPITLTKLNYWHPLIKKITKLGISIENEPSLLARYSTFYLQRQSIEVTEVLLPGFWELVAC